VSQFFPTPDDLGRHTIFPGVHIRTAAADKMMLSVVDLEPGSVVEEHSHPHEQVGMLLAGRVLFTIGDEEKTLQPGDLWCIPGGVKHKVVVVEGPARALDVFCPVREEYR
jgi:quercetin dioxygenase-like cupin family protein